MEGFHRDALFNICMSRRLSLSQTPAVIPAADALSCPAAETKVASGGPPQDGEEQADKSLGADAGAPAAIADNSSAVKLAGSETMAEEQAGVTADKHKEDGGLGDLQKEDDGLGDLFQTLPAIRKFEGKHYKSRKEGVRDLATQVCAFVGEVRGAESATCGAYEACRAPSWHTLSEILSHGREELV